jgi:hypothetical protein
MDQQPRRVGPDAGDRPHARRLSPVAAGDTLVVELTRLSAHREDLMADWVRGVNRVRDLLTGIFPGLERAFDYSTRSALILLTGFQTPGSIRAAGEAGVAGYLREHRAWAKGILAMAVTAFGTAQSQTVQLPGEQATAVLIAGLAAQLLDLDRRLKDIDKLIAARFRAHPQAQIIESLPGFGPILGAEFVVATGGNLTGFATSGRLASLRWTRSRAAAGQFTTAFDSIMTGAGVNTVKIPP